MKRVKISVIVPVYNVIAYIDRCICSIINQTYRDFEVILVDDGSTDDSGLRCDEYALKYDYIKVIHKENGGLSDARNCGCLCSIGEYITFVDSDDYIDFTYLEKLYEVVSHTEAEIVICRIVDEDFCSKLKDQKSCSMKKSIIIYDNSEAIEEMCYELKFGTSACAKLFKRSIVIQYKFPIGVLYEDLATVYKYFGIASKIAFLDEELYHYVTRLGSIRNNSWSHRVFDVIIATNELLYYIKVNFPAKIHAGIQRYFFSANEVFVRAFGENNYLEIVGGIRRQMQLYWPYIVENKKISFKQKLRYWMMINIPKTYKMLWKIHKYKYKIKI